MSFTDKTFLLAAATAQLAFADAANAQTGATSVGDVLAVSIQKQLYAAKPDPDAMARYDMALLPESIDIDSIAIADEFFMGPSIKEVVDQAKVKNKQYLYMKEPDTAYFLSIPELKKLGEDYDALHQRIGRKERYAHAELRLLSTNGFACHSLPDDGKHVTEMSGRVFRYASAPTILDIGGHEIGHQYNELLPTPTREELLDSALMATMHNVATSTEMDADSVMAVESSPPRAEHALLILASVINGEIEAETDSLNKAYLTERRDEQFAVQQIDNSDKPHPSLIERIAYIRSLSGFCENGKTISVRPAQYKHQVLLVPATSGSK